MARHAPLNIAELDAGRSARRAAAKALAWDDPVELPPGRYEVVLEPTAVADILGTLAVSGFNGKAVNERRSFVRVGEAQLDPSITLVDDPLVWGYGYDAEGTPRDGCVLVESGAPAASPTTGARRPRPGPEHRARRRARRSSSGPFAPTPRARAAGRRGRRPRPRSRARSPTRRSPSSSPGSSAGILVSDLWYTRVLDPALARRDRPDPQRRVADRGRRGHGAGAQLPLHAVLRAGADAGQRRSVSGAYGHAVPGDTYTATSPRWSCPALHLASWNFTGGASG